MGLPICERLAAQGFAVATLTRNPEGRERATRANLQSESKIGGVVASADIVVSAVSDDAALLDIVFRPGGLKELLHATGCTPIIHLAIFRQRKSGRSWISCKRLAQASEEMMDSGSFYGCGERDAAARVARA
jgi:NAD(P)-dependent dehydrogenase (short-subunit alcohol dehydrogenase family)